MRGALRAFVDFHCSKANETIKGKHFTERRKENEDTRGAKNPAGVFRNVKRQRKGERAKILGSSDSIDAPSRRVRRLIQRFPHPSVRSASKCFFSSPAPQKYQRFSAVCARSIVKFVPMGTSLW